MSVLQFHCLTPPSQIKNKFCSPVPPRYTRPQHSDYSLVFIACGQKNQKNPCTLRLDITNAAVIAIHTGTHNHQKPPTKKPHPNSLLELQTVMATNPEAGPAKLRMGVPGHPSVADIDPTFINQDRLAHHRRKLKGQIRERSGDGIRNTTGDGYRETFELCHMTDYRDVFMNKSASIIV